MVTWWLNVMQLTCHMPNVGQASTSMICCVVSGYGDWRLGLQSEAERRLPVHWAEGTLYYSIADHWPLTRASESRNNHSSTAISVRMCWFFPEILGLGQLGILRIFLMAYKRCKTGSCPLAERFDYFDWYIWQAELSFNRFFRYPK